MNKVNQKTEILSKDNLRKSQKGFSLIELMIALTLGLVITGVIVQVFSSSRSTYDLEEGLAEVQEQGRFAMEFLSSDIRQSGNFGCAKLKNQAITNIVKTADGPASLLIDPFNPASTAPAGFIAYEYIGGGGTALNQWSPPLPANGFFDTLGAPGPELVPFSDVIVIQYATPLNVQLFNPGAPTNANVQLVNTPTSAGAFKANDVIFISDCRHADVFRVTNNPATAGPTITLAHGVSGNTQPLLENSYDNSAEIMKMATRAYFVGVNTNVSPEPSLYRLALDNNAWQPDPLVEGIEQLKVIMGLETAGTVVPTNDGLAEVYESPSETFANTNPFVPGTSRDMSKVVDVKVGIIVRSTKMIDAQAVKNNDIIAESNYTIFGTPSEIYRATPAPPVGDFDPELYRRRRLFTMTVQKRNK